MTKHKGMLKDSDTLVEEKITAISVYYVYLTDAKLNFTLGMAKTTD